jgi:hypothetical protein
MMSHLCNRCVREFLILARTWFAFGLPSKTGCDRVRDEKMLEKLATHDVETVTTLFALADKCARAAEGRAWHSAPQTGATQTGGSGTVAQDGKNKKKKNCGHEKSSSAALVIAAAARGQNERNKRPRP